MPPVKRSQVSETTRYYLSLPAGHPERVRWLQSGGGPVPKMKGRRGRSKKQIQRMLRRETFGGRFKCRKPECNLRFKTRKVRQHHEKYSYKHVGRVKAKVPLVLFGMDLEAEVQQSDVPFNPPRKRQNNRRKP